MATNEKRREFFRVVKFTLFSISAGLIQIGGYALLFETLHLPEWLAYLIALVASVVWNFTLNRKFTFQSASNVPKAMLLVFAYYAVFTPLSTGLEWLLTVKYTWNGYIVTVINMLLNFVTEFLYQRYVVFKKSIDSASKQ